NRTTKVLVEHYDKVTSTYAVKHEQAQRNIKTYFIIGRKRKDDDLSKAAASNGEAPVHPESVAISMENPETLIRNPTESDNLMKDAGAVEGEESAGKEEPLLNHYEPKERILITEQRISQMSRGSAALRYHTILASIAGSSL
ncbi:hypothetical protein ACJMK2_031643, partial [Sinanodonta woodiana]